MNLQEVLNGTVSLNSCIVHIVIVQLLIVLLKTDLHVRCFTCSRSTRYVMNSIDTDVDDIVLVTNKSYASSTHLLADHSLTLHTELINRGIL